EQWSFLIVLRQCAGDDLNTLTNFRRTIRLAALLAFFVSCRRRHTRSYGDWSSDVCSSDLVPRGRCVRLSREAGEHRAAAGDLAKVGRASRGENREAGVVVVAQYEKNGESDAGIVV